MKALLIIPEFKLEQNNSIIFLVLTTVIFSYVTYWIYIHSNSFKIFCAKYFKDDSFIIHKILIGRFLGFFVLGVVPILILVSFTNFSLNSLGLQFPVENIDVHLKWISILGVMAVFVNWLRRNNKENLLKYPQIRISKWNKALVIKNIISWNFYLIGYEILFRGVLLFPLYYILGPVPAIIINSILYSLAHFPKGKSESIGSILLGTILCVLTLETGTIYIAFFVHVILAISNFLISLNQHRKMDYSNLKSTAS